MWTLPKGDSFLPKISLKKLRRRYTAEKKAKPKLRLLCAICRKEGGSIDDVAARVSMKRRTVHEILRRFDERGIGGKDSIKQTGQPFHLTLKQRKDLIKRLDRGLPNNKSGLWTTKEVRAFIKKKYGVEYAHSHTWLILKAAGFSMQKPRNRHYKAATPQVKADFKKKLPGWHAFIGKKVL
jgi:transposase